MSTSSVPPLPFLSPPPPNLQPPPSLNLESKISPSILLIIIILAIIFFVSGLLHLLVRCLLRPTQRDPDEVENTTALQGQLQQLFHLHDAGVDQSYIDTLPVFHYKAIIGVKDPFDCAVCLCEFEPDDKLRLLPKCSHAFHMECIDTWLLSHSTCPLCRSSLLVDFSGSDRGYRNPIPIVCVLESGAGSVENSREIRRVSVSESESHSHLGMGMGMGMGMQDLGGNGKEDEEKIVTVKLGKFRNVEGGECSSVDNGNGNDNDNSISNNNNNAGGGTGGDDNNNLGSRRCFSMGSFAYVMDERTSLQVPIRTPMKKQSSKIKPSLPLKPGHRAALSEYGSDSMRDFNGIEAFRSIQEIQHHGNGKENGNGNENGNGDGNERSKRDSFSISKIWLRGGGEKNRKGNDCSSRRTISGIEIEESELGLDEETESCYSVDSLIHPATSTSASTKRTLMWLMGRHNKVVHNHNHSISSNV